jgi:hypothetical protein
MDLLGNKPHVLFILIGDWNVVFWFRPLVGVVEELFKLLGEGVFMAVFYLRLREMRQVGGQ